MAQQDSELNGEDFSQDVRAGEDEKMNGGSQQNDSMNGQHGSSETPGRDDDRLDFILLIYTIK